MYINFLKGMRVIGPLLYNRPVKSLLKTAINVFSPPGPEEERRKKGFAIFIGEATDQNGGRAASKLICPEGYTCTALTTVEIMKRILNNDFKLGFQTPSLAYGADFILQFDGVTREDVS
jgi:short subunit dehydrogenase-like uncharacterized protein